MFMCVQSICARQAGVWFWAVFGFLLRQLTLEPLLVHYPKYFVQDMVTGVQHSTLSHHPGYMSRSKLPYHPICTTRGSHPLNINSHSDSVSHQSSYLGLIVSPHLHLIHTHTHISSTLPCTHCEVLICPGCHF